MNRTRQREKLQAWLREAEMARRLREEAPACEPLPPRAVDCGGPPPASGQIRLWPAADAGDEPFYALLMPADYGHWLLIPFSPYATPATPAEWCLREQAPVQVLQFWNRRRVPRARAANSWCAETLAENEQSRIREALLRMQAGEALEEDGCGPPLLHPLDPRHEYLDEEAARVTRALGEAYALAEDDENALRLAAEPRSDDPYC